MNNIKNERVKMPKPLKAFIYCYIGGYPIAMYFTQGSKFPLVFSVLMLVIGSFFFSYGVVSFVLDIKKGGISKVIRKIKVFLHS